ncbi:MAG: glycosyltransferase, partial [Candidatus Dojkabacteria bacterium]|nr:glycosyltransferase [Candidatus Dojkabacteria bacterium]
IKDAKLKTELHAIDTWEGDEHAGYYGEEIYEKYLEIKNKYYKDVNIIDHKMFFDEAIDKFEDNSIDVLHIDGLHTYDAVKHDFQTWLPKVKKDSGIVLLHDVCEKSDGFGVYKLWDELNKEYNTITFEHYHGLGVLFLGNSIYKKITLFIDIWTKYYPLLSENIQNLKNVSDKETHIRNLEQKESQLLRKYKNLEKEHNDLENKHNDLEKEHNDLEKEHNNLEKEHNNLKKEHNDLEKEHNDLESSYNSLHKKNIVVEQKATEYENFQKTKIWKSLTIYRKFKKYFKNFFINLFRDGPILTFKRIFNRIKNIIRCRTGIPQEINPYEYWLQKNKITKTRKKAILLELQKLKYKPLISIVMPVYNIDVKWIKKAVKSVKNQIYPNWELCIADDASTNPQLIKYLKSLEKDPKIKITFREKNGHISEASNTALELAEGEFVALMDNDDIIHPHALAEIVKVLNKDKETDLIYSDEDKITTEEKRVEPFFKPDWSPDLFLSSNYLCHLTVIRKKIIDEVGRFRKGFEGSQDYDLFLRVTERTDNIKHIPDILYSWRKIPGSTASTYDQKGYADDAAIRALSEAINRRGLNATVREGLFPGSFRVKYNLENNPLVSILIPTKDKYEYIEKCISSIFEKTTYQNFEIIIIDTGSSEKRTIEYYESLKSNPKIRFLHWNKKFNYSAVNNYGVKHAGGEYILLLNNDTEVISPDWIEGMLEHAQRDKIGAVGVKMYYPNDTIQHAGVILGINGGDGRGVAGHAFKYYPRGIQGFPVQKDIIRNYSAVTAACLMIKKTRYQEVKGFNENFRIAFNDVDFCLKLLKNGYYNIYTPYVELYHHESISVGTPESNTRDIEEFAKEINIMYERWERKLLDDSFYNRNLTKNRENFSIEANK